MKKITFLTLIALVALTLVSCGSVTDTTSTGDTYDSAYLPIDYAGAISVRNQLALGTLRLEGTAFAPTTDEAQALIPLWQSLRSLQASGVAAPEEINAILAQIEESMRLEQLQEIAAMELTNLEMQAWASDNGILVGTGGGVPGQGQGMSPEARATKQAEEGVTSDSTGGSKMSSALIDAVITYLQTIYP